MKRRDKVRLYRIIISAVLLAAVKILDIRGLFETNFFLRLSGYLIPYAIVGYDIVCRAFINIIHGQMLDENFLMFIATIGAFFTGEYTEAVFVMLFYQTGELFQSIAVGKSRNSIKSLMSLKEDNATVEKDGKETMSRCEDVHIGEITVIRPGGKIPLDGVIVEGETQINTLAITGESLPRHAKTGDCVISGCINEGGLIKVRVEKEYSESTVSKILQLVENSQNNKSKSENFITKFAHYYTPAVVGCALLLAVIPPLILGMGQPEVWREWVYRALTFLVISCPCALVISIPLAYFGGIGSASKSGILIKGSAYLETLSKCDTVVFDKTGTLTYGVFNVNRIYTEPDYGEDEIILAAACAEKYSTHPISHSIREYCEKKGLCNDGALIEDVSELAGCGVCAYVDKKRILVGNAKLLNEYKINFKAAEETGSTVYVAKDDSYMGYIVISDEIKSDAREALENLKNTALVSQNGKKSLPIRTVMLTGDRETEAARVAGELCIDEYFAQLLPTDKAEFIESFKKDGKVIFVGDGINDAPVLAGADVGIAMGALGSDAAIEAADVVLMDDKLSAVVKAIRISRKTGRIAKENIIFALTVKAAVLILGAVGFAGMGLAIFADVGVAIIAILNSMRTLRL